MMASNAIDVLVMCMGLLGGVSDRVEGHASVACGQESDRRPAPSGETAGRGRRSCNQRPNSPRSRPFAPSLAVGLAASCVAPGTTPPDGISIAVDLLRTCTRQPGWLIVRWLP